MSLGLQAFLGTRNGRPSAVAGRVSSCTSSGTPVSVTPVNVTFSRFLDVDFANKRFERPKERQSAPENIPLAFSAPQIATIFARLRAVVAITSSQSQAIVFYKDTANDLRSTFSPLLRVHLTVFYTPLSARRDPALNRLADGEAPVKVAACYPRAVKWLFGSCKAPLDGKRTEVVNMRELSAEDAAETLLNDEVSPNLPEDGAMATMNGEKKI